MATGRLTKVIGLLALLPVRADHALSMAFPRRIIPSRIDTPSRRISWRRPRSRIIASFLHPTIPPCVANRSLRSKALRRCTLPPFLTFCPTPRVVQPQSKTPRFPPKSARCRSHSSQAKKRMAHLAEVGTVALAGSLGSGNLVGAAGTGVAAEGGVLAGTGDLIGSVLRFGFATFDAQSVQSSIRIALRALAYCKPERQGPSSSVSDWHPALKNSSPASTLSRIRPLLFAPWPARPCVSFRLPGSGSQRSSLMPFASRAPWPPFLL